MDTRGEGYFESLLPIGSVTEGGKGMEGSEARQNIEAYCKEGVYIIVTRKKRLRAQCLI